MAEVLVDRLDVCPQGSPNNILMHNLKYRECRPPLDRGRRSRYFRLPGVRLEGRCHWWSSRTSPIKEVQLRHLLREDAVQHVLPDQMWVPRRMRDIIRRPSDVWSHCGSVRLGRVWARRIMKWLRPHGRSIE